MASALKAKMYAGRVARRTITILDVPEEYREMVLEELEDSERERQERMLAEA